MIRIITLSIIVFSAIKSEEIPIGSAKPGSHYIVKNINGKESEIKTYKKEKGSK